MVSAWWLLPAFLIGGAAVFLLYDLWGVKLLDRLAARDAAQRTADHKKYRLQQAVLKLQRIWPDMTGPVLSDHALQAIAALTRNIPRVA